ncbi:hypothetical protein SMMN14_09240 [Sphaerulina musiva]
MSTRTETTYQTTRITRTYDKPFDKVLERLHSSIKKPSVGAGGLSILDDLSSKEAFESVTNAALGPHGFMQFQQFNHGDWMSLYGVNRGRKVVRIIFGNPQIAITMIRHDVGAALFVPVEVLIVEREDGKTDVVQVKPSTLIAGAEGSSGELKAAAQILDDKLEKLWEFVAE